MMMMMMMMMIKILATVITSDIKKQFYKEDLGFTAFQEYKLPVCARLRV